jgi:hypothetical protein
VLYTNGDAFVSTDYRPLPNHGVQWLRGRRRRRGQLLQRLVEPRRPEPGLDREPRKRRVRAARPGRGADPSGHGRRGGPRRGRSDRPGLGRHGALPAVRARRAPDGLAAGGPFDPPLGRSARGAAARPAAGARAGRPQRGDTGPARRGRRRAARRSALARGSRAPGAPVSRPPVPRRGGGAVPAAGSARAALRPLGVPRSGGRGGAPALDRRRAGLEAGDRSRSAGRRRLGAAVDARAADGPRRRGAARRGARLRRRPQRPAGGPGLVPRSRVGRRLGRRRRAARAGARAPPALRRGTPAARAGPWEAGAARGGAARDRARPVRRRDGVRPAPRGLRSRGAGDPRGESGARPRARRRSVPALPSARAGLRPGGSGSPGVGLGRRRTPRPTWPPRTHPALPAPNRPVPVDFFASPSGRFSYTNRAECRPFPGRGEGRTCVHRRS